MDGDDLRRLQQFIAHVQKSLEPSMQAFAQWQQQMKPHLDALGTRSQRLGRLQLPASAIADVHKLQGWFASHQTDVAAAIEVARVAYRRAISDNFHPLEPAVAMAALNLMSKDDGVVVVWVPPADIIEQLIEAATMAERNAILVDGAGDIAAAARGALDHVDRPPLRLLKRAITEAWSAWEAGHRLAAQALATSALGTVVHDLLAYRQFAQLKDEWRCDDALDEWPLIEIRYGLLMYRTAVAVERTDVGLPGYNRHASAHRVNADQYSEANALQSLMLVTAWARELQALEAHESLPDV